MSTFIYTRHLPTRDGKATMVIEANTPPEFTLITDRDDLDLSAEQVVVAYHERTKHHYHRYAASLGYLDWARQPDPFRRYIGAPVVRLPLPEEGRALPFWQLYVADNVVPVSAFGGLHPQLLPCDTHCSLTAWKQLPDFRNHMASLRAANPSSGNLPPDGGIRDLAVVGRYPATASRSIPLCIEGARSRASSGL